MPSTGCVHHQASAEDDEGLQLTAVNTGLQVPYPGCAAQESF